MQKGPYPRQLLQELGLREPIEWQSKLSRRRIRFRAIPDWRCRLMFCSGNEPSLVGAVVVLDFGVVFLCLVCSCQHRSRRLHHQSRLRSKKK